MKLPNNGGNRTPIGHTLSPNETFSNGNRLHLPEFLAKSFPWEPLNNTDCCQNYKLYKLMAKPYYWKNNHTSHWIWRSWACAYIETSPEWTNVFGSERYSAHYQMRNVNTNPATNSLIYNCVLLVRYARAMLARTLWEQPTRICFDLSPTPWDGTHTSTAWVTKSLILDRPGPRINLILLVKKNTI